MCQEIAKKQIFMSNILRAKAAMRERKRILLKEN
jgi:hypothetical protein